MSADEVVTQAVRAVKRAGKFTDNIEFSPEAAGRSDEDFLWQPHYQTASDLYPTPLALTQYRINANAKGAGGVGGVYLPQCFVYNSVPYYKDYEYLSLPKEEYKAI